MTAPRFIAALVVLLVATSFLSQTGRGASIFAGFFFLFGLVCLVMAAAAERE
jgi:hypothetical protein